MRAYAIIKTTCGAPALPEGVELQGFALGAAAGDWGMYQIVGTSGQLQAVGALDIGQAVGISALANLAEVMGAATRARIDAWADANFPSLPSVPAGWTNEQVVRELYGRANSHYVHEAFFIAPGAIVAEPVAKTLVLARADRKSTRLNSSHKDTSRMPSSA